MPVTTLIAVTPRVTYGSVAFEPAGLAVADEIKPMARPALSITRIVEELIHEPFICGWRFVLEKGRHLGRSRRHADQIEVHAPR